MLADERVLDGYSPLGEADPTIRDSARGFAESPQNEHRRASLHVVAPQEPLAFVESEGFQRCCGGVIVANILVLWGETDFPDRPYWYAVDCLFLLAFTAEIALRVLHKKSLRDFFSGPDRWWSVFDSAVVCIGVFDQFLLPLLLGVSPGQSPLGDSMILRTFRLLRLVRLLRVFKMAKQLQDLATALVHMADQIMCIFLVLFLVIYCAAVPLVHVVGHGEGLEDDVSDSVENLQRYFADVGTGMFTLFQLCTVDNWDDIADPLISLSAWWRVFFVIFIVFASWSLNSILAAEASDRMIEATSDRKDQMAAVTESKHKEFINFLRDAFLDADADGNGLLDLEEFEALMEKDFVHQRMRDLEINMRRDELMKTFAMLDVDDSGELTIEEFVDGLGYLQEGLATKHIVNVDYSLKRVEKRVETRFEALRESSDEVTTQHEDILSRLRRQRTLHDKSQTCLWLFRKWAVGRTDVEGLEAALCVLPPTMSPAPDPEAATRREVRSSARRSRASARSVFGSVRRGSQDRLQPSNFRVGEEVLVAAGEFAGEMGTVDCVADDSITISVNGSSASLTAAQLADGAVVPKGDLDVIHSSDRL